MYTKNVLAALLLVIIAHLSNAQQNQKAFIGVGGGLDYGGLGIRGEAQPVKNLGIFFGFGYNLHVPAYNAGVSLKFLTKHRVRPMVTAMYGYNGVIKTTVTLYSSKTYYGFSVGTGVEVYDKDKKNKLALQIFLPFRDGFDKYYKEITHRGFKVKTAGTGVAASIGYHFSIGKKKN